MKTGIFSFWGPKSKPAATAPIANKEAAPEPSLDALKKLIKDTLGNARVLSHVQLHFIAKHYDLQIGHYSDFRGKMPIEKIFRLPRAENPLPEFFHLTSIKLQTCTLSLPDTQFGNDYYTSDEKASFEQYIQQILSQNKNREVSACFIKVHPMFVIAPKEMFDETKTFITGSDPIVFRMIAEDQFEILDFWDTPEKLAVHLSSINMN